MRNGPGWRERAWRLSLLVRYGIGFWWVDRKRGWRERLRSRDRIWGFVFGVGLGVVVGLIVRPLVLVLVLGRR